MCDVAYSLPSSAAVVSYKLPSFSHVQNRYQYPPPVKRQCRPRPACYILVVAGKQTTRLLLNLTLPCLQLMRLHWWAKHQNDDTAKKLLSGEQ